MCLSHFSHHGNKIPNISNLMEERFILDHVPEVSGHIWLQHRNHVVEGATGEENDRYHGSQEADREKRRTGREKYPRRSGPLPIRSLLLTAPS